MNIGIDVDGVLLDMSTFLKRYGSSFFRRQPVSPSAYTAEEMYEVSKGAVTLFGLRWFFPVYCRTYPPYEGAADVYASLCEKGHIILQITSRKLVTKRSPLAALSRFLLKQWLYRNRFYYHELILCEEEGVAGQKLRCCLERQVQVMIEDHAETALLLAEHGISVLLYDAPYNQRVRDPRIHRVRNWEEIAAFFRKNEKGGSP